MVTDFITNVSIPSASNSKDFSKKKKANRSAKLKQCKLDARREQWLSQSSVKDKNSKEEEKVVRDPSREPSLENLETRRRPRGGENDGSITDAESSSPSPSTSPTSLASSVLGRGNDSGTNYAGSSISCGSCSCSITEDEEGGGDDGCLDDWEALADALATDDKKQQKPCSEMPPDNETVGKLEVQMPRPYCKRGAPRPDCTRGLSRPDSRRGVSKVAPVSSRTWRPDDAFRPQSLPNLAKQRSLPNSGRNYSNGGVTWSRKTVISTPSSCPICYEDLDLTDSSFLPCPCGFHLCLFCHKRIVEDDGRCPGCRKPYEHDPVEAEASFHGGCLTFRLARSCSMFSR